MNNVQISYHSKFNLPSLDLSMSLKVKSNGEVGFPIHDIIVVFNCNICCNSVMKYKPLKF